MTDQNEIKRSQKQQDENQEQGLKKFINIPESLPSYSEIEKLMNTFRVNNLVNENTTSFKQKIDTFLGIYDYKMEGFKGPSIQRDFSIKFRWGHNHDFGDFYLDGQMGNRHISILSTFMDSFRNVPKKLDGLKVLDIGCWTGGTSLLLCALGAHVVAIEEVKKYVECLSYLKEAFNIKNLNPLNLSLYDLTNSEFQDRFDLILYAGVLYHVSDPIISLRIVFNCLKDGGLCLLETAALDSKERILSYEGPSIFGSGSRKKMNRSGWNWYFPSPSTIYYMMIDVGFAEVQVSNVTNNRSFAVGRRGTHVDIMRSGLSFRNIR